MFADLISKENEKSLSDKGFTIVKFKDTKLIDELSEAYYKLTPKSYYNNYTSFEITESKSRKEIDLEIKKILGEKLKSSLPGFNALWGNYMVKAAKKQNMELHADWTYVDEQKSFSMNLWVPLQNCNVKNGTLWVVPYSHKVVKSIRGINLPRFYFKHNELLKNNYGIPINLKKGEGILYDHRLIHYSYPNFSDERRIAATLIYTPKNKPVFFYWQNQNTGLIEEYLVPDSNFFYEVGFSSAPQLNLLKSFSPHEIKDITEADIQLHLKKTNLFKRLWLKHRLTKLQNSI